MKDKHKDCRKYCKKCGNILGENIDGKPICHCETCWEVYNLKKLGNITNVKIPKNN